jgi:hypothetical protein
LFLEIEEWIFGRTWRRGEKKSKKRSSRNAF